MPEVFAMGVRLALQDPAYLSVVSAFSSEHGVDVDCEIFGSDGRIGTPLSVALERRVAPVEAPISQVARLQVVLALLEQRANPARPGPYCAWWGGDPSAQLIAFAAANKCADEELLTLLASEGMRRSIVVNSVSAERVSD